MTTAERLSDVWRDPAARRWTIVCLVVTVAHLVLFTLMAPSARLDQRTLSATREVEPILLDITPRARPARIPPPVADGAPGRPVSSLPPVIVRPSASTAPSEVAPLVTPIAPPEVRPTRPGRIIPQSWRERCGLGAGEVSDADYAACRDGFVQAAAPPPGYRPPGPRGDPSQDFAAQGAANIARYEYFRSPAPTGSGNAGPSSANGSNFGMGGMTDSVIYATGSRPQTMGRSD